MTDERPMCWMCAEGAMKDGAEIERLCAQVAKLREAVEWYAERAVSLGTKDWDERPQYAEAILTELMLDAGRRARAALKETE